MYDHFVHYQFIFININIFFFYQGSWLYNSTQLMSKIKIAQLRAKFKEEQKNKKLLKTD